MKNYPNQASTFARIRGTLAVVRTLNQDGNDATDDTVLGYACARQGVYTFRGLDFTTATAAQLDARMAAEQAKPPAFQGVRTFARELRRTLRDMGWLDALAHVTKDGEAVLASVPDSVEEQALLVEGLLRIETAYKDGGSFHHPVPVMLKLLARAPSLHRRGLELALEPDDDSDGEFKRVQALYELAPARRLQQLGISNSQRANAVKIFPSLAVTAGLVVEDEDGYFSLSQDGWRVIGQAPKAAGQAIKQRRGRRTTVGRLVNTKTIAKRHNTKPPRTLTAEEQARAAAKLRERTANHQALIKRFAALIGDDAGPLFEDEYSYDMLWLPEQQALAAHLVEGKTVDNDTDAYARVRHAVGQLSYYDYFYVAPTVRGRKIQRIALFDTSIPGPLAEYLQHEAIAAIVYPAAGSPAVGVNPLGRQVLAALPKMQGGS